mgnify:CR=1 FL=1
MRWWHSQQIAKNHRYGCYQNNLSGPDFKFLTGFLFSHSKATHAKEVKMTSPYHGTQSLSPSMACAVKTVYATFEILKESDGNLPSKEVMNKIPGKINLTDWEKERYEKTGYIRWQSILHFYTIDCSKAEIGRAHV